MRTMARGDYTVARVIGASGVRQRVGVRECHAANIHDLAVRAVERRLYVLPSRDALAVLTGCADDPSLLTQAEVEAFACEVETLRGMP